jgi:hypothetical protein
VDRSSQQDRRSAPGDPEAEAHFFRAQLRAGELELRRLQLWSYFGHEPATLALDGRAPARPVDLLMWFLGLGRWGAEPITLVVVALADRALPLIEACAKDLLPAAREIYAALRPVSRGEEDAHRLRRLYVPFGRAAYELRRNKDPRKPSPLYALLLLERAAQVSVALSEENLRRALDELEWLGRAALAIPRWTDTLLLSEVQAEALPQLLEPATS